MISVVIFTLRDTMRQVQETFNIPAYGVKHTTPGIKKEIAVLTEYLETDRVQESIQGSSRPANQEVTAVRDLLATGAAYSRTKKAFARYRKDVRKVENLGIQHEDGSDSEESNGEPGDEFGQDYYEPEKDDLADDEDEPLYQFLNDNIGEID